MSNTFTPKKTVSVVIDENGNIVGVAGLDPDVDVAIVNYEEGGEDSAIWDGIETWPDGEEPYVTVSESSNLSQHEQLKGMGDFASTYLSDKRNGLI